MQRSNTPSTVAIVGAGITGPTTALALAQIGHDVTIYEQRPAGQLFSAGILGITRGNWLALSKAGVNLAPYELTNHTYRDYDLGSVQSPFRFVVWTDAHGAIVRAARDAGVTFWFETPVNVDKLQADYVIDAGGIVSAGRRGLSNHYIGSVIYRGISDRDTAEAFTTYKLPNREGFLDIGQTHAGASWAMGVRRPKPEHLRATFTDTPPREANDLPPEFRRIVKATPHMMILPQSTWTTADAMHDEAWRRFTLGDANGPVRPITTSGANLGIQAGMLAPRLLKGSAETASLLLRRRTHAIELGLRLTGPEIGGTLEDPEFHRNQLALYGAGAQ